jgi:DNA-binding transcriptional regulator of glucitol operon
VIDVRTLFTSPKWLLLHAVAVAAAIAMLMLGSWQWGRAGDSGRVQNYAYAAQWLLFAAFTVVAYAKLARDEIRPEQDDEPAPVADLPVRAQPAAPLAADDDPELAAYNAYLRSLAEKRS